MYINRNYSALRFVKLQRALPKFVDVGLGHDFGYEIRQKELLKYFGIGRIKVGSKMFSLKSKRCHGDIVNLKG